MGNLCAKSQINICEVCNNKITNINSTICDVCNHNIELNKRKIINNETMSVSSSDYDNSQSELDDDNAEIIQINDIPNDTNQTDIININNEISDTNQTDNETSDTEIVQNVITFDKKYIKCNKIVLNANQKISVTLK